MFVFIKFDQVSKISVLHYIKKMLYLENYFVLKFLKFKHRIWMYNTINT